jgi:integrase
MLANLPGPREGKVFGYACKSTAENHWKAAEKAAGLPHLPFHRCRHGFATGLLHAGVDPVTVAELGGWKSRRLVVETYGHAMKDKTLADRLIGPPQTHKRRKSL